MKATLTVLSICILSGVLFYLTTPDPLGAHEEMVHRKLGSPQLTTEARDLVALYKAKRSPDQNIVGKHSGFLTEYRSWLGFEKSEFYEVSYYFDGNSVAKSVHYSIEDYDGSRATTMKGKAKFKWDGSVLVYSDITGDAGLFPLFGEPVEIGDDGSIFMFPELGGGDNKKIKLTKQQLVSYVPYH